MRYYCPICETIYETNHTNPTVCPYCFTPIQTEPYADSVKEAIGIPFTSDFPNHSKDFPFTGKDVVASASEKLYNITNKNVEGENKMMERRIITVEIEILTQPGVWKDSEIEEMVLSKIKKEVICDYASISKHQIFEGEVCKEDEEEIVVAKIIELDKRAEAEQSKRSAEVE